MEIIYWVIAAFVFIGGIRGKRGLAPLVVSAAIAVIWPISIAGFLLFAAYVMLFDKEKNR